MYVVARAKMIQYQCKEINTDRNSDSAECVDAIVAMGTFGEIATASRCANHVSAGETGVL